MTRKGLGAVFLAALLSSCATAPPRPPTGEAEEFIFPGFRPDEVRRDEAVALQKAWTALGIGDLAGAEKRYARILARSPGLIAAETGLAYARLRAGRLDEAQRLFDSALSRRAEYVPALVGRAATALRQGKPEDALSPLQRAAALDRSNEVVQRRFAEVRLQVIDRRVAAARTEAAASRLAEAGDIYRQALEMAPELSGIRLELAALLIRQDALDEAASVLEADPAGERQILIPLGELQERRQQPEAALLVYRTLLARDAGDQEALLGVSRIRRLLEMRQMPEEYRRIPEAPFIMRADLAALLAVKVTALSRLTPGRPAVAIDISGSWARDHIIRALAFDLLPVYPNHTFQPGATVRRGDLARAVQQVLDLLQVPARPGPPVTDMSSANPLHYSAARVVAAGLMDLSPTGAFEPWRPVSGQQAADVLDALVRLVGP